MYLPALFLTMCLDQAGYRHSKRPASRLDHQVPIVNSLTAIHWCRCHNTASSIQMESPANSNHSMSRRSRTENPVSVGRQPSHNPVEMNESHSWSSHLQPSLSIDWWSQPPSVLPNHPHKLHKWKQKSPAAAPMKPATAADRHHY